MPDSSHFSYVNTAALATAPVQKYVMLVQLRLWMVKQLLDENLCIASRKSVCKGMSA